jgi:hypothetical protein
MTKRLSFCITCKNRLWQVEKVLPVNLRDNAADRQDVEFVLVDFDTPGLREFVQHTAVCQDALRDGYLRYFHTAALPYWHASVAKNTSHMLARAPLVMNLDCDNFLGKRGARFILDVFDAYGPDILFHQRAANICNSSYGRIALSKAAFAELGGYNERFLPVGYQDHDLVSRFTAKWPRRTLVRYAGPKPTTKGTQANAAAAALALAPTTATAAVPMAVPVASSGMREVRRNGRTVYVAYPLSRSPKFVGQKGSMKTANVDPKFKNRARPIEDNASTSRRDISAGRLTSNQGQAYLGVDPKTLSEPFAPTARGGGSAPSQKSGRRVLARNRATPKAQPSQKRREQTHKTARSNL